MTLFAILTMKLFLRAFVAITSVIETEKNILIVDIVVIVVFIAGESTVIMDVVDGIIFCLV